MRGYKAFEKGLICRGKQYKENTVFEEETAELCESGMHFCENPLDTLYYYPLIDDNGDLTEFAKVEPLDEVKADNYRGCCTKKLKIGEKLKLTELIKESINFLLEKTEHKTSTDELASGSILRLAMSDASSELAASRNCAQLAVSGEFSQLATSGSSSRVATSGYESKLVASGDRTRVAASGEYSQLSASGHSSQIATSGDATRVAASGNNSKIVSSGYSSQLAASGEYSRLSSSGHNSQIAASGKNSYLSASGNNTQLASVGDYSYLDTSGKYSKLASVGDYSRITVEGENSVAVAMGVGSIIKGVIGTWITLAEYEHINGEYVCKCVKSAQIDGEILKADTWYKLENGEFVEV